MELVKGQTLADLLEQGSEFEESQIISIATKLSESINLLHDLKIAHRDIKPENILVSAEGMVKLVDFGISAEFQIRNSDEGNRTFKARFFTQICSPLYAAPEIKNGECYSEAVDIWGIGIVLKAMLRNTEFDDKNVMKDFDTNFNRKRTLSQKVDVILEMTLKTDPLDRPTA